MTERISSEEVRKLAEQMDYTRPENVDVHTLSGWVHKILALAAQMEADEKNIVKAQTYADSRALAALQEMSHGINLPDMFKVQKDGQAYAVPPETLKGVYEALEQRFLEMRDWSYLRQAESEMNLWLTKLLELQERIKGRVLVSVETYQHPVGKQYIATLLLGDECAAGTTPEEALENLQAAIDKEAQE